MRVGIRFMMLTILASAMAAGCDRFRPNSSDGESQSDDATPAATVSVHSVEIETVAHKISIPGTIEADQMVKLHPRVAGYIGIIQVDIGSTVTNGQQLVTILDPSLDSEVNRLKQQVTFRQREVASRQAEVRQAQSRVAEHQALAEFRNAELNRISTLVGEGALNTVKLEEAKLALAASKATLQRASRDIETADTNVASAEAAVKVAQADVASAQVIADFRNITAPFAGVVVERNVDKGAYVEPASGGDKMSLLTIVAPLSPGSRTEWPPPYGGAEPPDHRVPTP